MVYQLPEGNRRVLHSRFPFRNPEGSLNVACAPFEQREDICNGTADIFIFVFRKTRFSVQKLELLCKLREMFYWPLNTLSIKNIFQQN